MSRILTALVATTALAAPAAAEFQVSLFTGWQGSLASQVRGEDEGDSFDFQANWEGRPFEMPPHWGIRATWWHTERLGFGADFNHTKVYASDEDLVEFGFDTLEFTDGLNSLTANVFYRWPGLWMKSRLTPYVGGGFGVTIPHVEVRRTGSENDTYGYQLAGPSAMFAAGASYALNENWSIFGEYKSTLQMVKTDLDGGGYLDSKIPTLALNFGFGYTF